jgi:hypothetical protein
MIHLLNWAAASSAVVSFGVATLQIVRPRLLRSRFVKATESTRAAGLRRDDLRVLEEIARAGTITLPELVVQTQVAPIHVLASVRRLADKDIRPFGVRVEHLEPVSTGGIDSPSNLVVSLVPSSSVSDLPVVPVVPMVQPEFANSVRELGRVADLKSESPEDLNPQLERAIKDLER